MRAGMKWGVDGPQQQREAMKRKKKKTQRGVGWPSQVIRDQKLGLTLAERGGSRPSIWNGASTTYNLISIKIGTPRGWCASTMMDSSSRNRLPLNAQLLFLFCFFLKVVDSFRSHRGILVNPRIWEFQLPNVIHKEQVQRFIPQISCEQTNTDTQKNELNVSKLILIKLANEAKCIVNPVRPIPRPKRAGNAQ